MSQYLAIDFGGTQSRAALLDDDMRVIRRAETLSRVSDGPVAALDRLVQLADSVTNSDVAPSAIGIAAPGPLDTEAGVIIKAETLPGWSDVPIAASLSDAFAGAPAYVDNDANLGALAEYHLGAGQGADPMIYLTISTGIGGGAIIGGEIFTGAGGHAIEPGHMRLTLPDGSVRRLEELTSGTALGHWARHQLDASPLPSPLRNARSIDGRAVGEAALAGDSLALECVREAGVWLGLGLVNLLHLFNPAAIVLGGSVMKLGDLILDPAQKVMDAHILYEGFLPDNVLRLAKLGEDVCLVGAALHARQSVDL